MAKALQDWIASDVRRVSGRPLRWLSERHFFRDPRRSVFVDSSCFFAPADGVILYQRVAEPDQAVVELKGRPYTLHEAVRDGQFNQRCLVIGIFMTVYDVHVNRIPFAGSLRYRVLPNIDTYNRPMLPVETALLHGRIQALDGAGYLFSNQRTLNRVDAPALGLAYFILQIADYDVSAILPFELRQQRHYAQGQRFSQVRFGSQVDLIIPLSSRWEFATVLPDLSHVEAGVDPLVRIAPRGSAR